MILTVGSVSLDTVETPFGFKAEMLGGSAIFSCVAASFYDFVYLVGIVGHDFPKDHIDYLRSLSINLDGLTISHGKTFRWIGRNFDDCFETKTIQKNVLGSFNPRISKDQKKISTVFLANLDPLIQSNVLNQVEKPKLVIIDTCIYYITNSYGILREVIKKVDIVLMNVNEAKEYSNSKNHKKAAKTILEEGASVVVIKKGKEGAELFTKSGYFLSIPAYPVKKVIDNTGAGDSFAGGFVGFLSKVDKITVDSLKQAVFIGNVMGSFAVEDFGIEKFKTTSYGDIYQRYIALNHFFTR